MKNEDKISRWAIELQSLAQAGLYYSEDVYDQERYQRIREIAAERMAERTGLPTDKITHLFCNDTGYQTPKLDTRAAIFKEDKILLVHESDGNWSLPGGWCDLDQSPMENTIKEVKEEAGLDAAVRSVISVQDRAKHNQPSYAYGVVKIFYLCESLGGAFAPNSETTETGYFAEHELPGLAEEKCNREQIEMCFQAYRSQNWVTQFD